MCLARVFTDEEMDEWLEGQPEVIEVFCIAIDDIDCYESLNYGEKYVGSLNHAAKTPIEEPKAKYWSGYHSFPDLSLIAPIRKSIKKHPRASFLDPRPVVLLKCLVRKEDITAVGMDKNPTPGHFDLHIVIVASQAIFPHYPETEARLEDLPKEEIAQTEMAVAEKQMQTDTK